MNAVERLLGSDALVRHAERVALVCDGESIRYGELAMRVSRVAAALRALGVHPGDRVLILLRDTPDFAATWLGIVWCGAVAIGLNIRLSEEEHRFIAADSAARLLVTEPSLRRDLGMRAIEVGELLDSPRSVDAHPAGVEAPAFWLYSSGTTGRPKGMIHTHRSILAAGQAQREVLRLTEADRVMGSSRLFFAYALENVLLGPLSIGASAILHPDWPEPESFAALAARERPSAFFSVPSFYRRLMALPAERLEPFRQLRHCVAAGERMPASILEQWRERTGKEILSIYGMSETFCVCMMTPPGSATAARAGKPLAGVEVRLLTADGAPVSGTEPGIAWVRHPALCAGYVNRPAEQREQFRDGWYCTKDMFTRDAEGHFLHQGRSDELLKVAGQWVQPGEVEEAALGDPAIAEVACVPCADEDGFERLALFVAPRAAPDQAVDAALRACESRLPRHKRPKWVRPVAELPRTATGKVQRFKLRALLEGELGAGRPGAAQSNTAKEG
jgi:benzoate-CoA ligase